MTALSVVIVSYNSSGCLPACLASVRECTQGIDYDVTVVDNASRDGTPAMLRAEFPWVRLIARTSNIGYAGAINAGVRAADGAHIAVINADVRITNDAFSTLDAYLSEHPDTGIVAPKLLDDDGALQLSCRAFPGYATAVFNRYSLVTKLFPSNRYSRDYLMADFDHASIRDVDWVSGAGLLFTRAAFDRVGGWDAGFFMFNEDVDFCRRVHDAGLRVVYDPDAVVYHSIGVSAHPSPRMIVTRHQSMWRYYRKHMRAGTARDAITGAAIAARCMVTLASFGLQRMIAGVRRRGANAKAQR